MNKLEIDDIRYFLDRIEGIEHDETILRYLNFIKILATNEMERIKQKIEKE